MKRIFSFALITLFMLAFVLSGCSQPAAQGPDADSGQASSAAEENPAGADGPVWTEILNFEISHETNICGFLDEGLGITVGYSGEAHYTKDGAQKWPQARNTSMCLFCLDIVDGKIAWAGGNGNDIRMSSDGGMSWVRREDAEIGARQTNIDFVDGKIGWVANLSRLAATQDGGMTWTELALPENAESIAAVCLRSPQCGYLLTHSGLLFTTADGGATWNEQDLKLGSYNVADTKGNPGLNKKDIALADISFADEKNGTIVFAGMIPGQGFITVCLVTTDGGATWASRPIPDVGFTVKKVFLTSDGNYLTLGSDSNQTALLKRQE